jgi:predicted DNA-binding WGR domain protein
MKRLFEAVSDTSSKFWEITLQDSKIAVRFGKLNTAGQRQEKSFASSGAACHEYLSSIEEKLRKGYLERTDLSQPFGRAEFEAALGEISVLEDAQKWIVDWCKTMAQAEPSADGPHPTLLNGTLYNIGFLRQGLELDTFPFDWRRLAEDVIFVRQLTYLLSEAGCTSSMFSDTDASYYPVVLHGVMNPESLERDGLAALGVAADFIKNPEYQTVMPYEFFGLEAMQEQIKEGDAEPEDYAEQMKAMRAVEKRMAQLESPWEVAIVGGYDAFPILKLGRTAHGTWLGLISSVQNPDLYPLG